VANFAAHRKDKDMKTWVDKAGCDFPDLAIVLPIIDG
jgi:hypothetical protein